MHHERTRGAYESRGSAAFLAVAPGLRMSARRPLVSRPNSRLFHECAVSSPHNSDLCTSRWGFSPSEKNETTRLPALMQSEREAAPTLLVQKSEVRVRRQEPGGGSRAKVRGSGGGGRPGDIAPTLLVQKSWVRAEAEAGSRVPGGQAPAAATSPGRCARQTTARTPRAIRAPGTSQ